MNYFFLSDSHEYVVHNKNIAYTIFGDNRRLVN